MNIRFFAPGRDPETSYLQLDKVGVKTDLESKKIVVDESERTSAKNIYSIGDAIFVRVAVNKLKKYAPSHRLTYLYFYVMRNFLTFTWTF